MKWRSVETDFPDWKDSGKTELRMRDGTTVSGVLRVADVGFNGEDEYPVFDFVSDKGESVDFYSCIEYRRMTRGDTTRKE